MLSQAGGIVSDIEKQTLFEDMLDVLNKGFVTLFVWSTDSGWPIQYVSNNVHELLGYDADYLSEKQVSYAKLIHPEDVHRVQSEVNACLSDKENSFNLYYRLISRSGCVRWVREFSILQKNSLGELTSIHGYIQDQTDQRDAEESSRIAALIRQHSREAIMITDKEGRILSVNPTFTRVTGYQCDEVKGLRPSFLSSGHHDTAFYTAMWNSIHATGHWQGEILDRRKNGEIYPKWLSIHTVYDDQGSVLRRVGIFSDISKQKQSEELIWKQANFDALTGLPNRQLLSLRLKQEINRLKRTGKSLALIFLDLDSFKTINDSLGHLVGDELLIQVGKRLTSTLRTIDMVARFSGDEFALLMTDLKDQYGIERVAMKVRNAFDQPFPVNNELIHITACFGVTLCPEDGKDPWALMKNADQAMFTAKNKGRGRYQFFTEPMQLIAHRNMKLAKDLRAALKGDQFHLVYQPIINFTDNHISKIEALIRWQHPELGDISPVEFISIAEEIGLISDIGDWVFRTAVLELKKWQLVSQKPIQISINTSPAQYQDDIARIHNWLVFLQEHNIDASMVSLEITEGMLMETNSDIENCLLLIRDSGMEVALDDFGTGYSSLSYLKKMSVDALKIDRSFVQNLEPNSDDLALCEAMIVMAHKLGIHVVAEGIETELQRSLLEAAGCDYGQGYWFYRPLTQEQILSELTARQPKGQT